MFSSGFELDHYTCRFHVILVPCKLKEIVMSNEIRRTNCLALTNLNKIGRFALFFYQQFKTFTYFVITRRKIAVTILSTLNNWFAE